MDNKRDFHWLHFSDLHLAPGAKFANRTARKELLKFLRNEIAHGRLPCDYVFITGDIAQRGNYDNAKEFITELLKTLNCSMDKKNRVFWAVGNHDISRDNELRKLIITEVLRSDKNHDFRERVSLSSEELFEEWMEDPIFTELLLSKGMEKYFTWHRELLGKEPFSDDKHAHVRYSLPNLNLIVLNTCLVSCDDHDEHQLHINKGELLDLFDDLDQRNPTFVIGHHGQEFFTKNTKDELGHLFDSNNVDLYLCGHSHRLGYDVFSQAGRDIYQLTCGGGEVDQYSKLSFIHGYYNGNIEKPEVIIRPYSYAEKGNCQWQFDGTLHRRLAGDYPLALTGKKKPSSEITDAVNAKNAGIVKDSDEKDWSSSFFAVFANNSKKDE